jgi:aerotaxis receptor
VTGRLLARFGVSASETADGATAVADSAGDVNKRTDEIMGISDQVRSSAAQTDATISELKRRLVIALRQSAAGDRRSSDRLPCAIPIELDVSGRRYRTSTVDLSPGGMLVNAEGLPVLTQGSLLSAELPGVGRIDCPIVGTSPLGIHIRIEPLEATVAAALKLRYGELERGFASDIERARDAAVQVSHGMEEVLRQGEIDAEALFSPDLEPLAGYDPQQYISPSSPFLERLLPDILERLPAADPPRRVLPRCRQDRLCRGP